MHLNELHSVWTPDDALWLNRLAALNIRHVEQLGSLLASPVGEMALARLQVPITRVKTELRRPLSSKFGLSLERPHSASAAATAPLIVRERFQMGYAVGPEDNEFRTAGFGSPVPAPHDDPTDPGRAGQTEETAAEISRALPAEAVVGPTNPFTARDQGRRGTCVSFAVAAMYQTAQAAKNERPLLLSPQYLHYLAKANDDLNPDEDGTSLDAALRQLRDQGCCLESRLPYVPRHDLRQVYTIRGHKPTQVEQELRTLARQRRIQSYRTLTRHSVHAKAELAAGKAVGVGVAVYELAWYNSLARTRGEIALPPMETTDSGDTMLDTPLGGHAVVLVGYRDNSLESSVESHRPGGGHFIFRNSWGEDWAPGNAFGRGYGYLPYEYLDRFCLESAVIEDLAPAQRSTRTKTAVKPKPTPKTRVVKRSTVKRSTVKKATKKRLR